MQVDTRWAQSAVSELAPVHVTSDAAPQIENDENNRRPPIENQPTTTGHTSTATSTSFFPPQRVEPIDMARTHQQISSNHKKTGYIQPAVNDENQPTASYMQNRPIKRVKHPTDHSSLIAFLQRSTTFCFSLLISLPFIVFITLFAPVSWFIRTIIRLTCRIQCTVSPCSCSYLSAGDLFWFYHTHIDYDQDKHEAMTKLKSTTLSPTAAALFFLEGAINENSLKKLLLNRLINSSARRGSNVGRKLFPRFSQLVVSRLSGTMWIDYSLFSIDDHVREIPQDVQSDQDLQAYVSLLTSTDLTRSRPLWQLHYKNRSSARSHESILIFVYHPVLSDGISLIRILLKHVVDNRTTQLDIKPRFAGSHGERTFDYIKAYLLGYRLLLGKLFFNSLPENFLKRKSSPIPSKQPILTTDSPQRLNNRRRVVVWSDPFSLTQATRIKLVTRTRMNDILSTLVISTVKLYMEHHGISRPPNMNCVIPCDLRTNTSTIVMGNQLSHLSFEIPMDVEGNIPVLWSFNENMKRVKENGDYAVMHLFTDITYLLFPTFLANKIMARVYNNASLWLTTLAAGTSTNLATMSICNRDVRSFVCLGPMTGTASISFCVTSYADEIRLAVIADPQFVPNPKFFTECFLQQLGIVYDLLAHRRIPGEIRRIIRPPRIQPPKKSISSISEMSDDLTIEEIQAKMTTLQQELLSLKSQFENVDTDEPSSQHQRIIITNKLEELRREFRELLIKLQERQCEMSGMIPSDEEDEMDPQVRVRLRSASVASKISLRSNDQRLISTKMYHMDKEEGNEFDVNMLHAGPSVSKISLTTQPFPNQNAGLRRAQSVGACDNSQLNMQQMKSTNFSRPHSPSQGLTVNTNTTIIHLEPGEH